MLLKYDRAGVVAGGKNIVGNLFCRWKNSFEILGARGVAGVIKKVTTGSLEKLENLIRWLGKHVDITISLHP